VRLQDVQLKRADTTRVLVRIVAFGTEVGRLRRRQPRRCCLTGAPLSWPHRAGSNWANQVTDTEPQSAQLVGNVVRPRPQEPDLNRVRPTANTGLSALIFGPDLGVFDINDGGLGTASHLTGSARAPDGGDSPSVDVADGLAACQLPRAPLEPEGVVVAAGG
jgi:hypothetical protein